MSFPKIKMSLATVVRGSVPSNSAQNLHVDVRPASAIKHVAGKINVRFSYVQSTAVDLADVSDESDYQFFNPFVSQKLGVSLFHVSKCC